MNCAGAARGGVVGTDIRLLARWMLPELLAAPAQGLSHSMGSCGLELLPLADGGCTWRPAWPQ
eukprot:4173324-Heterocapsa_arctica.AAC.1